MNSSVKSLKEAIKNWYVPLLLGLIFIAFGAYTLTVPLATYLSLSIIFSCSFIISGIFDSWFALENRKSFSAWGWFLVSGLLSLSLGIYLAVYPEVSAAVLPSYVGFTLLFRSFQLLGFSFEMKAMENINWGSLALTSVLGILFSFLLLANPVATGFSLVTLTGLAFIFVGIAGIVLAFQLKKVKVAGQKLKDSFSAS
ncbi:hypothetical protein BWD42_07435 [Sphingobacterium sp. CZ-UAM]|uniref:HdeD family acid-resistance protein n=1 Tax=Sphingobacterium sp. CZ-UAM TaxID=1933868 RepID=UPI0009870AFA|nr:DUF308 domain-containing protein [Sphingobacterium sp. CZ-UAM]OOG19727.1 hypothetical protein BWD42_07435 [Sphingobacterium sp. CZ-UAM]